MLDKIAGKIIEKEIDLKEYNLTEFSYEELEIFLNKDLDIYNKVHPSEDPKFHSPIRKFEETMIKENPLKTKGSPTKMSPEKPSRGIEEDKDDTFNLSRTRTALKSGGETDQEAAEKEEKLVKETIEYILNGKDYISLDELKEVLAPYLRKQQYCMEELYRLKQYVKERQCTLLESFQTYKDDDRFKTTELYPDEYLTVLHSIGFNITEESVYKCLDCFDMSAHGKIDYIDFCTRAEYAINPRAKGLRNLRKFKNDEEIYEYIADQCEIYFPLGPLLKDHDYNKNGKVTTYQLEKILRKGAPEMTEGDLQYFLDKLCDEYGEISSKELINNVNYYIRDREKRQKLVSHIPEKILHPLDKTEKDRKMERAERWLDRQASKGYDTRDDRSNKSDASRGRRRDDKLDKLNEKIAKKIEKHKIDLEKIYKQIDPDERGMMREEDLEEIIKRDIRFDIYNDELDLLFHHYGEG